MEEMCGNQVAFWNLKLRHYIREIQLWLVTVKGWL